MRADADSDPQGRREEEEQDKQPGDLGSVDDLSDDDDDLLIVIFDTGAGGVAVDMIAELCRFVARGLIVLWW